MNKKSHILTEPATKADLQGLELRVELRFDAFERKVKDLITTAMDKLYTRIDPILSEVENARVDRVMSTESIENLRRTTRDHEKRITKLENN